MKRIHYAIPSYKRADKQLTLKMLRDFGIDKDDIVISTQTEEDYEEYSRLYGDECNVIYKAGNSASDNRNTLLEYFAEGDWVLMLDDDISGFYSLNENKLDKITDGEKLVEMFASFFEYTEKHNGMMWGIYPVKNAFFMKKSINKRGIVNGCMGIINYWKFDNNYRTKEDFELCCRVMRSGKNVIRFNFVTYDIKQKQKGGCCEDWKAIEENENIAYNLVCTYPEFLKINPRRKGEVTFIGDRN